MEKKKKKVYVNKDAGNVPYNMWMFNHSVKKDEPVQVSVDLAQGSDMTANAEMGNAVMESANKKTYSYYGEVYRFDDCIDEVPFNDPIYTQAISLKQAINNIKAKLKDSYGFSYNTKLDIQENNVKLVDDDVDDFEYMNMEKYCDNCGARLTDSGLCPKCDNLELDM